MSDKLSSHICKLIFMLLFVSGVSSNVLVGQEKISGIINKYAKVNTIGAGYAIINNLTQASQFSAGDYVLLIQMQGVGIQTVQGAYGINVQSQFGSPGGYEFMRIQSVNNATGRIDFTRNTYFNSYDVTGNLQLIRVPFYNSPTVTGNLTSQTWNSSSGTGGVLAMMVGRKLTLNADINVSGQGFTGAAGVSGIGECVRTNESAYNHDSYPLSWTNAGLKGEGIAIQNSSGTPLYPDNAKGQGRNFSGGGGGNGMYSGGGGGSNRGKGGDGGLEISASCENDPRDGGYGGMNIAGTIIQNGIFAGGGGGASTQASGATASSGGNGGGIIFIIADTIDSENHLIRSSGISASGAVGNAGAGGGGAGGSIAICFQGFSSQVQLTANGGNGGSNSGNFGLGGGGGGGLIWLSTVSTPVFVTGSTISGGTPKPTIESEGDGEIKYSFVPNLNGFLFNSIRSANTGTQVDSVCSNTLFGQITGTFPVGGTAPYTYQWQSSITSASEGFSAAAGINNQQHYTPPQLLTQTTWFRRVVTDNGASVTDISVPVRIVVHPYIKNNVTGNADTVCYGQNAPLLFSLLTIEDGNGIYSFSWQESTDNSSFIKTSGNTENYQPSGVLTKTTWYRRLVNSGACSDISSSVRINVLDTIKNNSILTAAQEICQGMSFTDLSGTNTSTLRGGDNNYSFRWESSNDGSSWVVAAGTSNGVNYNPDESSSYFPGQEYYRRIVYSGSNNVCVNTSKSVLIKEYPSITNNLISPDVQTVCSGTSLLQLTGTQPQNGKGAGTYTYTWQDSTKTHLWADIPDYTGVVSQNFATPALTDTISYRRIVYSSACSSTSNSVIVNVHKSVAGNTISLQGGLTDTTICYEAVPHRIIGSVTSGGTGIPDDYAYQWSSSPDNTTWSDISGSGNSGLNYQPEGLTATTYFRRRATSGECSSESRTVKITVLPSIKDNTITGDQTVCKGTLPAPLTQSLDVTISGGSGSGSYSYLWEESHEGLTWKDATGTNNSSNGNYQPPVVTKDMMYRRLVSSGPESCCFSTSNIVSLSLDSLLPGTKINAGGDTTIYSFDNVIQMTADETFSGGTGRWTLIDGTGSFVDDSDNDTKVEGLSMGQNSFLWTVTKGACKLEDTVEVFVYNMSIPEGFSPNNDPDNLNNTFVIKGLDLPNQIAELKIVNGAGSEVFSTSNRNGNEWNNWDGTNLKGKDLPEGTYYYLLKITSKANGKVFKKSGFVILKRY